MATRFITVSIEIMHDKKLNQSQKFLLAEIEQLSSLEGGCYASNSHFCELIGITKENVSKNLNSLKKMGYIDIKTVNGSRNHNRLITLIKTVTPLIKIVRPPYQNSKTPLSKQQETKENIQNNIQYNNISEPTSIQTPKQTKQKKAELTGDILIDRFIAYRGEIKKPMTQGAVALFVKKINSLKDSYDIEALIDDAIMNGWQSIYPKDEYKLTNKKDDWKGWK